MSLYKPILVRGTAFKVSGEFVTYEKTRPSSLKVLRPSSQDLDLSVVMASR